MYRPGPAAGFRPPGDRSSESPVDLEDPHPIAITRQPSAISGRQSVSRNGENLPRREVEEYRPRRRKLRQRGDSSTSLNRPAQLSQQRCKRVPDSLRSSTWQRPTGRVAGDAQHERVRGARRLFQRKLRVTGQASDERRDRAPSPASVSPDSNRNALPAARIAWRVPDAAGCETGPPVPERVSWNRLRASPSACDSPSHRRPGRGPSRRLSDPAPPRYRHQADEPTAAVDGSTPTHARPMAGL